MHIFDLSSTARLSDEEIGKPDKPFDRRAQVKLYRNRSNIYT